MKKQSDSTQAFIFERAPVRGRIVYLADALNEITTRHNNSEIESQLLAETMLSAILMLYGIKFDGQITLQFQSHDAIKCLVAKANSDGMLKGFITCNDTLESPMLGQGHMVITLQHAKNKEQQQSIVAIKQGQTISSALSRYFLQSEQLPSIFQFCISEGKAVGIMLQKLPDEDENDDWNTVTHLFNTLEDAELLNLDLKTILHRLFHEYSLKLFDEESLTFQCDCTIQKMADAIRTLGIDDALSIFDEQEKITVTCEYCCGNYHFDKAQVLSFFEAE